MLRFRECSSQSSRLFSLPLRASFQKQNGIDLPQVIKDAFQCLGEVYPCIIYSNFQFITVIRTNSKSLTKKKPLSPIRDRTLYHRQTLRCLLQFLASSNHLSMCRNKACPGTDPRGTSSSIPQIYFYQQTLLLSIIVDITPPTSCQLSSYPSKVRKMLFFGD